MRKRWLWILLALLAVLLIAKHFLLDTPALATEKYRIDLDALHRVATASGPLPSNIEVEKVAEFAFPRTIVVAGDGFKMHPMVLLAHRVVWPDRSLIIDTAMSAKDTQALPGAQTDPAASARLEKALRQASDIVFTHEHEDHVGGVAGSEDPLPLVKKIRITREQLNGPKFDRGRFPDGVVEKLQPLDYSGLHALAPGVVLQKAPGHSVGSQLIYVELADGKRFLFVGDIAWTKDNIRLQTGRPGLATLLMREDRAAVAAQVKAFAELPKDVHLVVAHDPVALKEELARGLFRLGFGGL